VSTTGRRFEALEYSLECRVFQSQANAVSYCMEVQTSWDGCYFVVEGYVNGRKVSASRNLVDVHMAMRYSARGYVANTRQAIECSYDHLQSLVLCGKV
jgi:hypothetical protein